MKWYKKNDPLFTMIAQLAGTIVSAKNSIVVQTSGGVGYRVFVKQTDLPTYVNGREVSLFTYLKVGEQAMDLYGFQTLEDKIFFELLLSVSGVGPKSALNILCLGSLDQIQKAIGRGDVTYLTQVSGIGKKTAERMVVELKSKMGNLKTEIRNQGDVVGDVLGEVVDGLVAMGYGKDEARAVAQGLDASGKTTEELLKEVLRNR